MLGIIGGTSLLFSDLPELTRQKIATPYGPAEVHTGEIALCLRHQFGLPPHRINHRASLAALALAGVDTVVAFGSAGSLQPEIPPGSLLIPSDYVSLTDIPSIHDHAIEHVSPGISDDIAGIIARVVPGARQGGVYVQTRGPRIETRAEVLALAKIADVVGMTLASEATLACELDMAFAALCTVDNYAHGLGEEVLTYDHILETSHRHRQRTGEILASIVETLK
ncbi:MAG: MTAP family purine nucleoside phosphorylase [Methanomicrobiales archaeon]|nr:MTAP family purine nucleoside phosphorylase [Methanomicrobiales archaeon]